MKKLLVMLMLATVASAQSTAVDVQQVADDAMVIDRVAEASKRDLPRDLLKRIVTEDIEILRGSRGDGSYQYARYERLEAARVENSYSLQARAANDETLQKLELRGSYVYRLIVASPSRRLVVTKNRRVWIERAEIDYIPEVGTGTKTHTQRIEAWLEPGSNRVIDLPEIGRQATARVFARGEEAGYGNLVLTLVQARIVDDPDSPYADAVASAKAMLRALDNSDVPSLRAMATRVRDSLQVSAVGATPSRATLQVVAPAPRTVESSIPAVELYVELQAIEDLLTGTPDERREGLDKLHQLVRRLRPVR